MESYSLTVWQTITWFNGSGLQLVREDTNLYQTLVPIFVIPLPDH